MMSNGYILYEGNSTLNGEKIVSVATGFNRPSENTKTGKMIQIYYLLADQRPMQALNSGDDIAICGDCPFRKVLVKKGSKKCYVRVFHGPTSVFTTYSNGSYPYLPDYSIFSGYKIRFGAYGDPTSAPIDIHLPILDHIAIDEDTGYTHQWRHCDPRFAMFLMASVESVADKELANSMGWRTFRVRKPGEPLLPDEFACPASRERNYACQCIDCMACSGNRVKRRNVSIIQHN